MHINWSTISTTHHIHPSIINTLVCILYSKTCISTLASEERYIFSCLLRIKVKLKVTVNVAYRLLMWLPVKVRYLSHCFHSLLKNCFVVLLLIKKGKQSKMHEIVIKYLLAAEFV